MGMSNHTTPRTQTLRSALALPLLAGALALTACDIDIEFDDGPLVEETYDTADFDSIRIDAPFDVTVRQGTDPSVVVRIGEERLDDVEIEVIDGELRIDISGRHFGNDDLVASITTTDLQRLQAGSASDVVLVGIDVDELTAEVVEASQLRVSGAIEELSLTLSEAAQADFDGTTIGHVNLTMSGASSAEFDDGTIEIEGSIRGASSLDVDETTTVRVDTRDASNIDRN